MSTNVSKYMHSYFVLHNRLDSLSFDPPGDSCILE